DRGRCDPAHVRGRSLCVLGGRDRCRRSGIPHPPAHRSVTRPIGPSRPSDRRSVWAPAVRRGGDDVRKSLRHPDRGRAPPHRAFRVGDPSRGEVAPTRVRRIDRWVRRGGRAGRSSAGGCPRQQLLGPLEVVGAAASFAIGSVILRRQRPQGETLWGVSVQFAMATVLLAALLPVLEPHPALPLTTGVLLAVAYLVIGPSLAGYTLYFYLHHHVGPGRANVVAYVNPVAALSIGTLVFMEPFQWWELAGFGLIVIGLTLVTYLRPPTPKPPP